MYLKALAQYDSQVVEAAVHMLRTSDKSPLARIDAFVSAPLVALKEPADTRGCFLCNASADRASLDVQTARMVRSGYDRMRAASPTPCMRLTRRCALKHAVNRPS